MGDDYIDDALSADEAQARQVLTCQMVPQSDCVIAVPVPSSACKTGSDALRRERWPASPDMPMPRWR